MRRASPLEILTLLLVTSVGCGEDSAAIGVSDAPTPTGTVRSVNLVTNALVFDRSRGAIYASVPSRVGENGNTVATIDPGSATVTDSLFVGSEPDVMAISDDDALLYIGLDGSAAVRRVDLAAHAASTTIALGNNDEGPRIAGDIAVMPGAPSTIAVSRSNGGFLPSFAGVVIFDDDIARPTELNAPTLVNRIEFADPTTIYGYDDEDDGFELVALSVDAQGVHQVRNRGGVLTGFNTDFVYDRGQLIGTSGQVVDATTFLASGSFAAQGPVVVDPSGSPVTFLQEAADNSLSLVSFDRERFVPLDPAVTVPVVLPGASMLPFRSTYGSFLRISATRFAFRTEDKVFILDLMER